MTASLVRSRLNKIESIKYKICRLRAAPFGRIGPSKREKIAPIKARTREGRVRISVTSKKLPNIYKSCPKMISLVK